MRIADLLQRATAQFKQVSLEGPRLEAELLLSECIRCLRQDLIIYPERQVEPSVVEKFQNWCERRSQREPFAYIVGGKYFYRHRFIVGPGVLIPRPETEMLVEHGIKWLKQRPEVEPLVMDLGCGTGCIGLSVSAEVGGKLILVDASDQALAYARSNSEELGLSSRVDLLHSRVQELELLNLQKSIPWGEVDLLLTNPPYIAPNDPHLSLEVRQFEPGLALFGGETGLEEFASWVPTIARLLSPGGLLLIEHGANQWEQVVKIILQQSQFEEVESYRDLAGWDRMVSARKKM